MPKKKQFNRKYLAVVLAISLVVVGGVLWLNYETPFYFHSEPVPILVTYHVGDSIGGTGYVLSALNGIFSNSAGSDAVYAYFEPTMPNGESTPGLITHDVADNTPFTIGNLQYAIISYGTDYIVMQEVTPMPM
jgi:hypothetical protein